ncbi:MAG: hypothetical protein IJY61_02280 [Candidatus Gastranaerophilales bacterium]|nr:hypothetical protein [Candidatus Gastranaerophilales bacterium]
MFFSCFNKSKKYASQYALECEVLRIKGDYKKALKNIDEAILLEPENDMFYASRSLVKKELSDNKGALEDIEKAILIQPSVKRYYEIKNQIL